MRFWAPYTLPCGHSICESCVLLKAPDNMNKCESCGSDIPDEYCYPLDISRVKLLEKDAQTEEGERLKQFLSPLAQSKPTPLGGFLCNPCQGQRREIVPRSMIEIFKTPEKQISRIPSNPPPLKRFNTNPSRKLSGEMFHRSKIDVFTTPERQISGTPNNPPCLKRRKNNF